MAAPVSHRVFCCFGRSAARQTTFDLSITTSWKVPAYRPLHHLSLSSISSRSTPSIRAHAQTNALKPSLLLAARHASSSSPSTAPTPAPQLSWDEFLQLRRTRRYISLVASIATATGTVAVALPLMAQNEIESTLAALTGMDPFIMIGITLTGIAGLGWLMGPFVGNAAFGFWKRGLRGEIAKREKDFYAHIKRYRADPASSSVNNPVPDYYGEKIASVADYRRWLKDQRAFLRKKNKNLL